MFFFDYCAWLWLNCSMKKYRILTLMLVALIPPLLAFAGSKTPVAQSDRVKPSRVTSARAKPATTKRQIKLAPAQKSLLTAADEKAIEAIAASLFKSVIQGEYAQGLERLQKVYALDKGQRSYLAERMLQLEQRVGRAQSYERLSRRFMPGSAKVVRVYYMTLHPLKPAIWALDFYRSPGLVKLGERAGKTEDKLSMTTGEQQAKWILTALRIETEAAFAQVEGSQTWHKKY